MSSSLSSLLPPIDPVGSSPSSPIVVTDDSPHPRFQPPPLGQCLGRFLNTDCSGYTLTNLICSKCKTTDIITANNQLAVISKQVFGQIQEMLPQRRFYLTATGTEKIVLIFDNQSAKESAVKKLAEIIHENVLLDYLPKVGYTTLKYSTRFKRFLPLNISLPLSIHGTMPPTFPPLPSTASHTSSSSSSSSSSMTGGPIWDEGESQAASSSSSSAPTSGAKRKQSPITNGEISDQEVEILEEISDEAVFSPETSGEKRRKGQKELPITRWQVDDIENGDEIYAFSKALAQKFKFTVNLPRYCRPEAIEAFGFAGSFCHFEIVPKKQISFQPDAELFTNYEIIKALSKEHFAEESVVCRKKKDKLTTYQIRIKTSSRNYVGMIAINNHPLAGEPRKSETAAGLPGVAAAAVTLPS